MLNNLHSIIIILQPIATEIIALVAVLGFFSTKWRWTQSNRPIISALVETYSSGNIATCYNLTIINSGNRPAINIKLTINDYQKFKECTDNKNEEIIEPIVRCFNRNAIIPLLVNGDKISNWFGTTSVKKEENTWKYGSSFPISITYGDLEDRKYKSKLVLYIKNSKAFADSSWSN